MYDPTLGVWMTEDPDAFKAADPNLYRYCGDNPTNLVDPSGLCPPRRGQCGTNCPQPATTAPNRSEERRDYELGSSNGAVHMSFLGYTPDRSLKLAMIVRAIANKIGAALDDLEYLIKYIKLVKNDPKARTEKGDTIYYSVLRWVIGPLDIQAFDPDASEPEKFKQVFEKVASGLRSNVIVFRDSPVPGDAKNEVYASSSWPGQNSKCPVKVGRPIDQDYKITTYPLFGLWKTRGFNMKPSFMN
jgi:hypothetical protein